MEVPVKIDRVVSGKLPLVEIRAVPSTSGSHLYQRVLVNSSTNKGSFCSVVARELSA